MVSEKIGATRIVCEVRLDNMEKPAEEFEIGRARYEQTSIRS